MLHFIRRHPRPVVMRVAIVVLIFLLAGLLLAPRAAAQTATRSAAILLVRGTDTILVQRSLRTDSTVQTVVAGRGLPRITVLYQLAPSHFITGATFFAQGPNSPDDAPALQRGSLALGSDTARIELAAGNTERVVRPATSREAFPLFNNDFTVLEQGVRLARARGVDTVSLALLALANAQTLRGTLELFAPDSARLTVMGNVTVASVDAAGNVTGGYLPGQNIRLIVVTGADAARVRIGAPDSSAPPGAPYTATDVTVRTPAGHTLAGTLTLPRDARGPVPAVVTITGSGQQDRDESIPIVSGFRLFRQVADTLGRRGIAVLRLDDRGIGGSGGDVSGTSADFADDIRAGIAYLRTQPEIDAARIALVGHSEGGMIAPMIAADDPQLAAIVLMAGPSQTGRQIIDYQLAMMLSLDTTIAAAQRDSALAATRAEFETGAGRAAWMRYFLDYDPLPTLRRVRQPVFVMHGATDRQVTVEQAEELARTLRAAGNSRVTVRTFEDRNHLFLRDPEGYPPGYSKLASGRVDSEVMGALADWLATTLQTP